MYDHYRHPPSVIRLIRRCDAPKLGKSKVNCERWIDFQEASRSHASLPIRCVTIANRKKGEYREMVEPRTALPTISRG